ncbi:S9 family peptidase [Pseudonocardia parietis]|uniref:Dipeptidyl aminopeptidase/acylaminoacyl peptidase n=1 Tax=Pseudonocardia parietis TaxID=570936 RepID=A0ABS4VUQ5_9PSEU|nr:S9 family peptidase [Pseudonocardia parietis]MBP2367526.1 dipeptidyl aminopeptidase/acylaminoacyl peptidase [Pseudonocardia parietis]
MNADLRDTPEYIAVTEYLRKLHEPGFGRPHALSGPHATSDGARVVVTGTVLDALQGLPRTAVYTAVDGELQPVSSLPGSSAHGARFSPDGSVLAFLSDRQTSGVFQLYLLEERFGEAVAAPEVLGTVEYAHWSPDGRRVLLGVAGLGADLAGAQGSGTVGAAAATAPESWQPLVETGEDDDAWRSLWAYTVGTGELTRLSPQGTNCWEAEWCGPDRVVVVASDGPSEDLWYGAALRLLAVGGGIGDEGDRELLRSEVQLGLPAGSPDGRYVAVVQAVCSDRGIVAGDITLIDLGSGERTAVETAGTDVTCLQWIDEGRLGYVGQRRLNSVAGIVDVATGRVREVLDWTHSCGGPRYPYATFTADGRVVVIEDSYELPHQVVLTAGEEHRVLASVAHPGTDFLSSVAGTARSVTWSAPDGLEIDGVLCTPSGDGSFPLVVNIHGGPVWAFRNTWSMVHAWVPLLVSRGYAVLNPNPRGSGGRGQEFAGRVVGDMGGADTHDYLAGIDALVAQGVVDPDRVGLIGGSYGGFMSSWLVTQDRRFAAAVPVSPVTDWYSQSLTSNISEWGLSLLGGDLVSPGTQAQTRSPALQAGNVRTPCLNVAGALDRCTPPGQAREFHHALRAHGVDSALVIYPEEGHGVRAYPALIDFLTRTLDWFGRYMPARRS